METADSYKFPSASKMREQSENGVVPFWKVHKAIEEASTEGWTKTAYSIENMSPVLIDKIMAVLKKNGYDVVRNDDRLLLEINW